MTVSIVPVVHGILGNRANYPELRMRKLIARSRNKDFPAAGKVLVDCLGQSVHAWMGMVDDEDACLWGLIPPTLLSEQAYLWLITTDLVEKHKFSFVRHSQMAVKEMLAKYPVIVGNTFADDPRAIQWLKWLGANFHRENDKRLSFRIGKAA